MKLSGATLTRYWQRIRNQPVSHRQSSRWCAAWSTPSTSREPFLHLRRAQHLGQHCRINTCARPHLDHRCPVDSLHAPIRRPRLSKAATPRDQHIAVLYLVFVSPSASSADTRRIAPTTTPSRFRTSITGTPGIQCLLPRILPLGDGRPSVTSAKNSDHGSYRGHTIGDGFLVWVGVRALRLF